MVFLLAVGFFFLFFVFVFFCWDGTKDKRERGGARRVWDILCGWSSRRKKKEEGPLFVCLFLWFFVSLTFSKTQRESRSRLCCVCGGKGSSEGFEGRWGDPEDAVGLDGQPGRAGWCFEEELEEGACVCA